MGVSEKNILQTDLERKKNLARLFFFHTMAFCVSKKKNAVTRGFGKENSYANQITDTSPHPLKSQMVGPLGLLPRINRS